MKYLHFNNPQDKHVERTYFKLVQSRTVAVEPKSKEQVLAISERYVNCNGELAMNLNIGVAFLGRKDNNYSRKIGREVASKKMKHVLLKVEGVEVNNTHIFIHLERHEGITISLRLNKKSGFSTVVGMM